MEPKVVPTQRSGVPVLRVVGELDLTGVAHLRESAADLPPAPVRVIDLRELTYIGSHGINCLVRIDEDGRGNGGCRTVFLVARSGIVRRALDVTGMAKVLEIAESHPGVD